MFLTVELQRNTEADLSQRFRSGDEWVSKCEWVCVFTEDWGGGQTVEVGLCEWRCAKKKKKKC